MTAIIIPAHNEAAVIGQTLKGLLRQVGEGDEVIVVCNGCSDDTAGVARRFEPRVTVLETDVPSKTNALNLGDRQPFEMAQGAGLSVRKSGVADAGQAAPQELVPISMGKGLVFAKLAGSACCKVGADGTVFRPA